MCRQLCFVAVVLHNILIVVRAKQVVVSQHGKHQRSTIANGLVPIVGIVAA